MTPRLRSSRPRKGSLGKAPRKSTGKRSLGKKSKARRSARKSPAVRRRRSATVARGPRVGLNAAAQESLLPMAEARRQGYESEYGDLTGLYYLLPGRRLVIDWWGRPRAVGMSADALDHTVEVLETDPDMHDAAGRLRVFDYLYPVVGRDDVTRKDMVEMERRLRQANNPAARVLRQIISDSDKAFGATRR
jgi:hypothetical protein